MTIRTDNPCNLNKVKEEQNAESQSIDFNKEYNDYTIRPYNYNNTDTQENFDWNTTSRIGIKGNYPKKNDYIRMLNNEIEENQRVQGNDIYSKNKEKDNKEEEEDYHKSISENSKERSESSNLGGQKEIENQGKQNRALIRRNTGITNKSKCTLKSNSNNSTITNKFSNLSLYTNKTVHSKQSKKSEYSGLYEDKPESDFKYNRINKERRKFMHNKHNQKPVHFDNIYRTKYKGSILSINKRRSQIHSQNKSINQTKKSHKTLDNQNVQDSDLLVNSPQQEEQNASIDDYNDLLDNPISKALLSQPDFFSIQDDFTSNIQMKSKRVSNTSFINSLFNYDRNMYFNVSAFDFRIIDENTDLSYLTISAKITALFIPLSIFKLLTVTFETVTTIFISQKYGETDMLDGMGIVIFYTNLTYSTIYFALSSSLNTLGGNAFANERYSVQGFTLEEPK
eukprot:CAMPEP_0170515568 /NCGR_PEP_ID=MMETSP0209-20121228/1991_1 /TAXON_ID=665100 ORGANISM="Litonotus pictus, Strain P1" /NCGR_SAMPLE_ID=MMETSP0209 /ASSEMBLY_ACC=CAM_ASM_000301 /LENGTH=452 /DNA_ID=CAMNT_0010800119 /DNA_START=127 /DNA_END=1486 /DNA_ORIENTATION=+